MEIIKKIILICLLTIPSSSLLAFAQVSIECQDAKGDVDYDLKSDVAGTYFAVGFWIINGKKYEVVNNNGIEEWQPSKVVIDLEDDKNTLWLSEQVLSENDAGKVVETEEDYTWFVSLVTTQNGVTEPLFEGHLLCNKKAKFLVRK